MTNEIPDFVVITRDRTSGQGREEHRLGNKLRNCFVRCPGCSEIWLVLNSKENELHQCAGCQHIFLIKFINTYSINLEIIKRLQRHKKN